MSEHDEPSNGSLSEETQTVELFLQCDQLVSARGEKPSEVFAVVMQRSRGDATFHEIGRTETLTNTSSPRFCTSLEISCEKDPDSSSVLRLDVYERKTLHTERLKDHEHRGTTLTTMANLLQARGQQLTLLLHHPHDPHDTGIVTLLFEYVDTTNAENKSIIQLDVVTSVLRRRDWNKTLLSQRYELCRAHRYEDEDGRTVWLPVYRSDRIGRQQPRDTNNTSFWEFSTASTCYRHLCNADEEREMRLTIYAVPLSIAKPGAKKKEVLLAKAVFTLRFVCEIDPTEEVLSLERCDCDSEDDIGNVSIIKAEPTDYGSQFSFRVNFDHTDKYMSAASDEKVTVSKKLKRLKFVKRKSPSPNTHVTSLSKLSLMDGLFQSGDDNVESNRLDTKESARPSCEIDEAAEQ